MDDVPKNINQISNIANSGDLSIGSCVKVVVDDDAHYGVIRWIGAPENSRTNKLMAAIELVILKLSINEDCVFFFSTN